MATIFGDVLYIPKSWDIYQPLASALPTFSAEELPSLCMRHAWAKHQEIFRFLDVATDAIHCRLQFGDVFLTIAARHQLWARKIVVPNEQGIAMPVSGGYVFSMTKESIGHVRWLEEYLSSHQIIKGPLKNTQLLKIPVRMGESSPLVWNENSIAHLGLKFHQKSLIFELMMRLNRPHMHEVIKGDDVHWKVAWLGIAKRPSAFKTYPAWVNMYIQKWSMV